MCWPAVADCIPSARTGPAAALLALFDGLGKIQCDPWWVGGCGGVCSVGNVKWVPFHKISSSFPWILAPVTGLTPPQCLSLSPLCPLAEHRECALHPHQVHFFLSLSLSSICSLSLSLALLLSLPLCPSASVSLCICVCLGLGLAVSLCVSRRDSVSVLISYSYFILSFTLFFISPSLTSGGARFTLSAPQSLTSLQPWCSSCSHGGSP